MPGDGLPVDGKGEGPSHLGIRQNTLADVRKDVVGSQIRIDPQVHGDLLGIGRHPRRGQRVGDVQLTGKVGALLGRRLVNGHEAHALEGYRSDIPVQFIAAHLDVLVGQPLRQYERPVADKGVRARPLPHPAGGIAFTQPVRGDRIPDRVQQGGKEVTDRVPQPQLEGARVDGFHADR